MSDVARIKAAFNGHGWSWTEQHHESTELHIKQEFKQAQMFSC